MKLKTVKDLENYRASLLERRPVEKIRVILSTDSTCCLLRGSRAVAQTLAEELERAGLSDSVALRLSGCLGFCEIEPMMIIKPLDLVYQRLTPEDVPEIVEKTLGRGEVIERLLFQDPLSGEKQRSKSDISFYRKQHRLIIGGNEEIEPTSIDDYIAAGGYASLARALGEIKPEELIEEVKQAGLRGRGGGGFPAWRKWQGCRQAMSEDGVRYVICNADEGDPGAYMDRSLLEGNPHSVIEGMIIGALAVGAGQGFVYVRSEYPLAVEHLNLALGQAEERGFLGDNILGSGRDFRVRVVRGAGAFVCGESTALIASLEGRVGRPQAKYVHTVEKGLWEKPTVLNNVETWANVPVIITQGASRYRQVGTADSTGTKIFSLVGKINNTGLVEVPMGITLRDIVFEIGGGVPGGKRFKAVQTGGPSGGCLPERCLDLAVDFDELKRSGSMMGSGGMIVLDEDTCMVDFARYFIAFLKEESCGKCSAREAVKRILEILERICAGHGGEEDLKLLEELGAYLKDTALCALGATAANPVLTTLAYFRDEYEAHIREAYCPAGVCRGLFSYEIDAELCNGCTACAKACPAGIISGEPKKPHHIGRGCIYCHQCYERCRFKAVKKVRRRGGEL